MTKAEIRIQPQTRITPASLIPPLLILLAGLSMLGYTWNTWPDSLYDFGSQLYYPWQITQGKHLYTDIACFRGPLSQYFNAAAFTLLGVSLQTLVWTNLSILAAVTILLYRLMREIGNRLSATVGCLVFLLVFAFSQYVGIGNYNWVTPYTHEVTHGAALSLAAIASFWKFSKSNQTRWAFLSGLCLGFSFLTTAEVFAPGAGAIALGMILILRHRSPQGSGGNLPSSPFLPAFLIHLVGVVLPIAIAFTLLFTIIPPHIAGRAVLGSWPWLFDPRIAELQFYRKGLGTDDLPANLRRLLILTLVYIIAFLLITITSKLQHRLRGIAPAILALVAITLLFTWQQIPWPEIARPWPFLIAIIAIFAAHAACTQTIQRATGLGSTKLTEVRPARTPPETKPSTPENAPQLQLQPTPQLLRAMLALYALLMLAKMALNARIAQYGFVLAMPAAMILIDALLITLPAWIARHNGCPRTARATAVLLISATVIVHLWVCHLFTSQAIYPVGQGSDQFLSSARGVEVEFARRAITSQLPLGNTLAVMPQGLMLNYLTRCPNPMRVVNLMPPELLSIGEDQTLADLQSHPPDLIILSQKDLSASGFILTEGHYEYGQTILRLDSIQLHPLRRIKTSPQSPPGTSLPLPQTPRQKAITSGCEERSPPAIPPGRPSIKYSSSQNETAPYSLPPPRAVPRPRGGPVISGSAA